MSSGKWSGVMSHCISKLNGILSSYQTFTNSSCPFIEVNCPAPTFAGNITVLESHPTKIVVKCPTEKNVEAICQSNGKWHPSEKEICAF